MMNLITATDLLNIGGTVLGIVGILLSISLILFPKQLFKLNDLLNKKVSTDHLRLVLEKEFDITTIIMQARILTGIITLLLSCILLIIAAKV
jgi:hypothetical protein